MLLKRKNKPDHVTADQEIQEQLTKMVKKRKKNPTAEEKFLM